MGKIKDFARRCWQWDVLRLFVYSAILDMVIETLNTRSLTGLLAPVLNPLVFFYNVLILMLTMCLALFTRRKIFAVSAVSAFWILLAGINFAVLYSRKTPFTAMDIYLLSDAIKVIPVYLSTFQIILTAAGAAAGIVLLVLLWLKAPKQKEAVNYLHGAIKTAAVGAVLAAATAIFMLSGIISNYFGNLADAYQQYGFAYCFSCSVVERGIDKPGGYSTELIEQMKEEVDSKEETDNEQKTPNIIFVQLESFFDPTLVKGAEFSEDPLPHFHSLESAFSSGFLSVPCFGAGTANTEFEVQTGINLDDFGPGEYPYKTVMQSKVCESAAYNLKSLGYHTHALHNNDGTFYNRNKVFSHLGYDAFTSVEYMYDIEYTPIGWAKDKILTGEIEKILDSTEEKDYIYTISVQGHGDYPEQMPEGYEPVIQMTAEAEGIGGDAFTYYVNQIHEMDNFIGELTQMLDARDEDTVLVMYGDHLPGFDFTDEMLFNGDIYQTQYVIWSNFDLPVEKKDMESFQLSAYVLGKLGISEGYITKYHQQQSDADDYLKGLKLMEYDILYGEQEIYNGQVPYKPTSLKMGTEEILVSEAYNYKDYVCVEGGRFNDFSVVFINDKACETEIINENLLRVKDVSLEPGDVVAVVQRGSDKIELSRVTLYDTETIEGG